MSYDNSNQGAIWPNQKKATERHPDFTGSLDVDGVEYWVSAWKRGPNDNPKSPSLKFKIKPKDEQAQAPQAAPADLDDDIPF